MNVPNLNPSGTKSEDHGRLFIYFILRYLKTHGRDEK
jgi:hypothetical protein